VAWSPLLRYLVPFKTKSKKELRHLQFYRKFKTSPKLGRGVNMSHLFFKTSFVLTITFIFISCTKKSDDINTLLTMMTGSFSSQNQAQVDTNFADIHLQMVQIWKERSDGFWLYVEQADANYLDQPYRQRIYHLSQINDSTFQSAIFTMKDPLQFAGEWKKTNPLTSITADMLSEKEGCAVILTKRGEGVYVGISESLICESDLQGADYATSVVLITTDQIYSWDRGFDINGNLVWGSKMGGYVFNRVK
jgi:CpeT protein